MRHIAFALFPLVIPAAACPQQLSVRQAVESITAEDVRTRIEALAHDSMRGRDTPSPEIEQTARYVAAQFRRLGLAPGGEGESFIQRYPIHRAEATEQATGPNAVGILEGSDPTLRNQYVVFSAHMDHLGVGRAVNGDSIYNGADDDASGTAAVLELAEAFAQLAPRPKRSMLFLTVSGEEHGLWGSDYFTRNPPVPIDAMVANLNIDMIGRNWDDTVVAIGKQHSDLGTTLDRVAAQHPELDMQPIDDIWPEERFYFRSDQYNFARRGVPVLFFFTGTHEDYHRPGDHVQKIDAEKEARIVRLIFYLGLEVANAAAKPQWKPESYAEIVNDRRKRRYRRYVRPSTTVASVASVDSVAPVAPVATVLS